MQADESPEAFWEFARHPPFADSNNDATPSQQQQQQQQEQCWTELRTHASRSLSPAMSQVFSLSMAIRQYSPRLEAFRHLATPTTTTEEHQPCCWAVVGADAVVTDPSTLQHTIDAALNNATTTTSTHEFASSVLLPFDHMHSAPTNTFNKTTPSRGLPVILYAPIGSPCAREFDSVLSEIDAKGAGAVIYAWRPLMPRRSCAPGCAGLGAGGQLTLYGYGVEMAIKNMEYNAKDDSQKKREEGQAPPSPTPKKSTEDVVIEDDEDVSGFKFATLIKRQPALRQELLTFRDRLLASASSDPSLNVWDLKDLGLQATQRVISASDPLHLLGEVAQNFPLLVEALWKARVNSSVRTASSSLSQKLPPQGQFLVINGIPYDVENFNLYDFIDTVRREVKLLDALGSAGGLVPPLARQAAVLRGSQSRGSGGGSDSVRVDIRPKEEDSGPKEVAWINDLEKDAAYKNLPRSLMALLQPNFMGGIPSVRRNVFNALLIFDPSSVQGILAGPAAEAMLSQRWPIRIGLMPLLRNATNTHSEKVGRLFAAVASTHGGRAAGQYMAAIANLISAKDVANSHTEEFGVKLATLAEKVFKAKWKQLAEFGSGGGGGNDDIEDDDDDEYADSSTVEKSVRAGDENRNDNPAKKLDSEDAFNQAMQGDGLVGTAAVGMLSAVKALLAKKGLISSSSLSSSGGGLVLNGLPIPVEDSTGGGWRQTLGSAWQGEMQGLGQDIYMGTLKDGASDMYAAVLKLKGAVPRFNPRALPSDGQSRKVLRLNSAAHAGDGDDRPPRLVAFHNDSGVAGVLSSINYFPPVLAASEDTGDADTDGDYNDAYDDDTRAPRNSKHGIKAPLVTHWVVVDPLSPSSLQLVSDAIQHESSISRVGILLNRLDRDWGNSASELAPIEQVILSAGASSLSTTFTRADWIDFFAELGGTINLEELTFKELTKYLPMEEAGNGDALAAAVAAAVPNAVERANTHTSFIRKTLLLPEHSTSVVTNGRVLEKRYDGDVVEEDFQLLEEGAVKRQFAGTALAKILSQVQYSTTSADEKKDIADTAMIVSSLLASFCPDDVNVNAKPLLRLLSEYKDTALSIDSPSSIENKHVSPLLLQAVLNPLSKTTQQLSAVLSSLRMALSPDIQVLLNPIRDYSDMPLKTFYRFAVPVDVEGIPPTAPAITSFTTLPPHKTLTLGMDVPEGWLVQPVRSAHDLDNLRLDELPASERYAEAEFELEALMVSGMCIDAAAAAARNWDAVHPRGVQLQLGTRAHPDQVDTLVMSNLGYFQLKSSPGVWQLRLAPGRSQELYTISMSSAAGEMMPAPEPMHPGEVVMVPVAVTGLGDRDVTLILRKDPAHMDEDVLDDSGSGSTGGKKKGGKSAASMWSALTQKSKGGSNTDKVGDDDDTIHVFTVASGHMYERLQKIMILSALKRTKNRLKFWFIKNYMSPAMKQFVPIMARQYDFDYEFVTYKWPSWLHKQTEKQRIIWAYKILFLDVLFPLNLKKVIFCDSDQVIRADLKDLWTMDLGGAPYGYTPFCDTNKEMEGFRFWKQGFWKDHLGGRPYHISALYVVDLERFRSTAAGDRLRVIYDGLSKDPNSLSNLDQDLPNYAQDTVPIFSLPQEWLWCETWCGEASRPQAKTIDLCNNPLTKEPKLHSARRIIAEWPDLNREAEEFTSRVDAVLAGEMGEEALADDTTRFMTYLEPMVEGSVRVTGGGGGSGDVHDEL